MQDIKWKYKLKIWIVNEPAALVCEPEVEPRQGRQCFEEGRRSPSPGANPYVKKWMCEKVKVWKSESVKKWMCEKVNVWKKWMCEKCECVKKWMCEKVKVWKSESVKRWKCEKSESVKKGESVKKWKCEKVKVWESESVKKV